MEQLSRLITFLFTALLIAAVLAFLFVGTVYLVAIVAPLMGLLYAGFRVFRARLYWRSHGRFPLPNEGIRIIGLARARWLAALELLSGCAGLVLSLGITALVFGHTHWTIAALVGGAMLHGVASGARRRVLAGVHPVDVLPPE